jgi:hypothetical protein
MKKENQKIYYHFELRARGKRKEIVELNNDLERLVNDKHRELIKYIDQGYTVP